MRELWRRIKNRFDELDIEIPFPHRTLYWGRGQAPLPGAATHGGAGDPGPRAGGTNPVEA